VPILVTLYATTGYFWDEFGRNPWEVSGGVSVIPTGTTNSVGTEIMC